MPQPNEQIEILRDEKWERVTYEADLGFGWCRFHFSDGQIAIAAPQRWRPLNGQNA